MKARKSAPKVSVSQRKKWLTLLQQGAVHPDAGSSKNNSPLKVVVDTNVLVSAILFGGNPEKALVHALENNTLILSDYIVDEFISVIKDMRPRLPIRWLRQLRQSLSAFCVDYNADMDIKIRDVNDVDIVKLAVSHDAIVLTNDNDLLEYKSHARVAILKVSEYSELFTL